jgi:hypothetical protein
MILSNGNQSEIWTLDFPIWMEYINSEKKKVLTVFESELDSQAQVEYFQTFDWPLSLYPFQVKVKLY